MKTAHPAGAVLIGALAVLIVSVVIFGLVALLLMWLMNLAFPLLPFEYGQSLALTGIMLLIGLPAMRN